MSGDIEARVAAIDWPAVSADLDARGWAIVRSLLSGGECDETAALYDHAEDFRAQVVMARHGFGRGEYRYFAYPLPPAIGRMRGALYARLAPVANRWREALGVEGRFPADHAGFLRRCHSAGQTRPTPLLLDYGPGDYNRLHQDLYGEHVFPLQATVLLSAPGQDFEGGRFVLTEQTPRMQSRVEVVDLDKGDAVIFATNSRPAKGARGFHRAKLRHGVSTVRAGHRRTLGIIFHDAA
ncbi:MAG: 2OG-Fe(II) oxygenase [Caulobacteraceae bacterium]